MRFIFPLIFLALMSVYSNAETESKIDYFFVFNGGIFIHEQGKAIEDFTHFALPEMKTYSNKVQAVDITPEGDAIAVLRGIKEEDDKIDLVRITKDKQITPFFTVQKRETLEDGRKKDRTFGDVDYDQSNEKAVFTTVERISEKLESIDTKVEYLSKIYQIPAKGGACKLVYEYEGIVEDITSGDGKIGFVGKKSTDENADLEFLVIETDKQTASNPLKIFTAKIINADFTSDGNELLILEKATAGSKPFKLGIISFGENSSGMKELVKEYAEEEVGKGYSFTTDGKNIIYTQKRISHWGENYLSFVMTRDGVVFPLVRDDFGRKFKPIPKPKKSDSEIKVFEVNTKISSNKNEKLEIVGTAINTQPVFLQKNPDGSASILENGSKKLDEFDAVTFPDGVKGVFVNQDKWFAVTELDLGDRLISFENIRYGNVHEKTIGGESANHDLHLSWNIGGRLVGLRIPENEIFIGGDDDFLHMVLFYQFKANYPATAFITPFYLLNRSNWMVERSHYFGDYKTESHYFVRSCADSEGNIYILDSLNSRVLKYDKALRESQIGWLPEDMPQMAYPSDMLIINEKIWINDPINERVLVFNMDGELSMLVKIDVLDGSFDNSRFLSIQENGFSIINTHNQHIVEVSLM